MGVLIWYLQHFLACACILHYFLAPPAFGSSGITVWLRNDPLPAASLVHRCDRSKGGTPFVASPLVTKMAGRRVNTTLHCFTTAVLSPNDPSVSHWAPVGDVSRP